MRQKIDFFFKLTKIKLFDERYERDIFFQKLD
jgi:hypothetical protein